MISIIIPANNEEGYIGACLDHILDSAYPVPANDPVQVIVVANGCIDATIAEAQAKAPKFVIKGWHFEVLDLAQGSKIAALNAGDQAARYDKIAYIDADITVSQDLIAQLAAALDCSVPIYASGHLQVPPAQSFISRFYARFWEKLPFIKKGVPGCGVYAVNAAGRARWGAFPEIISDDTFVRYHFAPHEMQGVPATFLWPITEGFANLVRVRRRQDEGLAEMHRLYPELSCRMAQTAPNSREKLRLFFRDPIGFAVYAAVSLSVRLPMFRNRGSWDRGR